MRRFVRPTPARNESTEAPDGLTISMSLLKLLGFDLTLESVPGHGSTFRISLANARGATVAEPIDRNTATPAEDVA